MTQCDDIKRIDQFWADENRKSWKACLPVCVDGHRRMVCIRSLISQLSAGFGRSTFLQKEIMALREELEKQGSWLFRWRSYFPIVIVPITIMALMEADILERLLGDPFGDLWESSAVAVSFLGLVIRCFTVGYVPRGTSGRNTKYQVAETLNTTGMYSITRNPLYLANFFIIVGIALCIQVWWFALIVWTGFWLYYERIIFTEEEYLRKKFGETFLLWAEKTPMIFPNIRLWRKPALAFSFKTILRREYSTYFSIVATFFFLEVGEEYFMKGQLFVHSSWVIFFLVSMAIYYTFFILKKKTRLLDVAGR